MFFRSRANPGGALRPSSSFWNMPALDDDTVYATPPLVPMSAVALPQEKAKKDAKKASKGKKSWWCKRPSKHEKKRRSIVEPTKKNQFPMCDDHYVEQGCPLAVVTVTCPEDIQAGLAHLRQLNIPERMRASPKMWRASSSASSFHTPEVDTYSLGGSQSFYYDVNSSRSSSPAPPSMRSLASYASSPSAADTLHAHERWAMQRKYDDVLLGVPPPLPDMHAMIRSQSARLYDFQR